MTGSHREQDVTFYSPERQEPLRYKFGVRLLQDGMEHFYLAGTLWEVRVQGDEIYTRHHEVPSSNNTRCERNDVYMK